MKAQSTTARRRDRMTAEAGEGVISTGIAVLIMALIGAVMWVTFDRVFNTAGTQIENEVNCVATESCD